MIHSASIDIAVCVVVSRLFRNHQTDHVKRNYILRELVTTVVCNLIIPTSPHDGEMRRYNTRYRGALSSSLHVKINARLLFFYLKRLLPSRGRARWYFSYDDARIYDCCTFVLYLCKKINKILYRYRELNEMRVKNNVTSSTY